jgi:hypothetical protein
LERPAAHPDAKSGTSSPSSLQTPQLRPSIESAVSLMLLLGAGVALRQVQRRAFNGPSFDASHLVGASFLLNMQGYDQARTVQLNTISSV